MAKTEQTRCTWRFKVLQQAGESSRNVAPTCRHFGISRQAFYKWKKRFDAQGTAYEKPLPGHRLQLDVKFLERIPGTRKRLYQFIAIDDCTRIRALKVYDACNQRTAIRFIDEVRHRLPFRIQVVQTDNGAEFQSQFHWHLEGSDIRHGYIRPARRI